jgi:gamma-glutamylputrescine oxidase
MFSIWEHEQFLQYDVVIIGSGITGLSTACSLLEKKPHLKVCLLERGQLPSGASTKNAGFACIGSFTEKVHDLKMMGEDTFLELIEARMKGLLKLRSRVGDANMEFEHHGGYELILPTMPSVSQDDLDAMNAVLYPLFKSEVFKLAPDKLKEFGFGHTRQLIYNWLEAQINTGKMMRTLIQRASSLGAHLMTGTEVLELSDTGKRIDIVCKSDVINRTITLAAEKVAVCTNAFIPSLLPEIEVHPGRGQVICTSAIPSLKFKGVFSIDEGYYYFRNYGNRVLLGGGRNLDYKAETTTEFGIHPLIHSRLLEYLNEIILPGEPYTIDYHWSGIMAFHPQKQPLVSMVKRGMWVAGRLNGMGVAIGSQVAENLATSMLNETK